MSGVKSAAESHENRLKRLQMRSWRRGMKEMDLILGPYADAHLPAMPDEVLALYDRLLGENDQDLYGWITGAGVPPAGFAALLGDIARHARTRQIGL